MNDISLMVCKIGLQDRFWGKLSTSFTVRLGLLAGEFRGGDGIATEFPDFAFSVSFFTVAAKVNGETSA